MSELTANASRPRSSAMSVRQIVCMAMLCAVAYVVMYISKTCLLTHLTLPTNREV